MNAIDGTEAVAEYIGGNPNTLRYWRHNGEGPVSFKVGRRVLYRKVDVDAWLQAQYEATARGQLVESGDPVGVPSAAS